MTKKLTTTQRHNRKKLNVVENIAFSLGGPKTKFLRIILLKTTTLGASFKTDLTRKDMKFSLETLLCQFFGHV